jgi:hypothetical protein
MQASLVGQLARGLPRERSSSRAKLGGAWEMPKPYLAFGIELESLLMKVTL